MSAFQFYPLELSLQITPLKRLPSTRPPSPRSRNLKTKDKALLMKAETNNPDSLSLVVEFDIISNQEIRSNKRKHNRVPLSDQSNGQDLKRPRKLFQKHDSDSRINVENKAYSIDLISTLPNEVLASIFRLLPALTKGRLSLVCNRWNDVVLKNNLLDSFDIDLYGMMIQNSMRHSKSLSSYLKRGRHSELTEQMRSTLIDWIIEVGEEFKMHSDTIFLTVQFIDRYLSSVEISLPKSQFQLLGVAALFIASKFEELSAPTVADLVFICDNTYPAADIIAMEASILNVLGFDLNIFTTRRFSQHFLNLSFDNEQKMDIPTKLVMTSIANYLTEISLLDYGISMQKPSKIAAAAVSIARKTLNYNPWPTYLQQESYFTLQDLEPCAKSVFGYATEGTKYQAAYVKYTSSHHQRVSSHTLKKFWTF